MLRIIKTEMDYFKVPLAAILVLLMFFTLFAFNDIQVLSKNDFFKKYFWSMIIGLGSYGIVFLLWMQRVKEKHERIMALLPISLKTKKWSRWIFAVLPLTTAFIYIQLLHPFLPENWKIHVARISAQIGFLSMALASILIIRDIWFIISTRRELFKIFTGAVIIIFTAMGAFIITFIFNYDIVEPLYVHQEEFFFFLWALLISLSSLITYGMRKNYLE
jgi:hypothetical protein